MIEAGAAMAAKTAGEIKIQSELQQVLQQESFRLGEANGREISNPEVLKQRETEAASEIRDFLDNNSEQEIDRKSNWTEEGELSSYPKDSQEPEYVERNTIKKSLEGQVHPETSVPFERDYLDHADGIKETGVFPKFDSKFDVQLPKELYKSTDYHQFKECNNQLTEAVDTNPNLANKFDSNQLEQIKNGDKPEGYTWHHHQREGKMELVDELQHSKTGHTGGKEIWGGGNEFR